MPTFLGAKFGYYAATLLMFGCIPLHILASYLIANSYIRPFFDYIVESKYQIPKVPEERAVRFSIVFMAVPGLSYAMKNYLLSLSGVLFQHYFLSGFFINGVMGVPVIIAGNFLKHRPFLLIFIYLYHQGLSQFSANFISKIRNFLIDYQKEILYRPANISGIYPFIINKITKLLTSKERY